MEEIAQFRKSVSLPPDLAGEVENYRFERRFKSESDALRRLIELGLKAEGLSERAIVAAR